MSQTFLDKSLTQLRNFNSKKDYQNIYKLIKRHSSAHVITKFMFTVKEFITF